ncbi:zinc finger CCCH domain-containing protein 13-like [Narcine bancroftii]|uniref:zinc finger CCCH domain-containing protein 13-like n=1 Tax=Narcine bancroftii TaxID=1343680 RepID=UPI0038315E50
MEEEYSAEIYLNIINDKRNDQKREQNSKKNRNEERQRSKHKQNRKAERRESTEKEENIQRQGTGEDVGIVKGEEESKRNDNEGEVVNHVNSVNVVQTPPSSQENWIIKKEKTGKSIKFAVAHNRWDSLDPGSKVRSRNDQHDTDHGQFRGKRDSRGGGEKILDRSEKVVLADTHPKLKKGGSEKHRNASEEWTNWVDPYISLSSHPPRYSPEKEEVTEHHQYCASPESFTERNSRIAHIMRSNLSDPELKVNQRRVEKPQWAEAPVTRSERQRFPDVHLDMPELAPHPSLESESLGPTLQTATWPSAGHTGRKSRSREDIGDGHSAPAFPAENLNTTSETPRGTAKEVGSNRGSREDQCSSGRRGERDHKWGGEEILGRREKGADQESREGRSEERLAESWGDLYTNPSSRLPKHSDLVGPECGEQMRCVPEKDSDPSGKPTEPKLNTSPKSGGTASREVRRKHLKNRGLSAAQERSDIQPEAPQRMDAELTISRTHGTTVAAEQGPHALGDALLPPESLARKPRKGSRHKNTVVAGAPGSWGGGETGSAAVQGSDGYGEGNIRAEGPSGAENWEQKFSPVIQSQAKHRDRCPENAEKENNHRSRRPRFSHNGENPSVSPYSHVFTVTTKSNGTEVISSLQEQRLDFSETALSRQPVSAYGSPNQLSLSSAAPIKDSQQDISDGPDSDGIALTCKAPDPDDHAEPSDADNSRQRSRRQSQRDLHCDPEDDGEREVDANPTSAHSSSSRRQGATTPSQGMVALSDVLRPVVLASWTRGAAVVSSGISATSGNFAHQPRKRIWRTRKRYQEEARAAVRIQAAWKGHQTRAQFQKQKEAAVIIQAAYRGYRIRKIFTDFSWAIENEMQVMRRLGWGYSVIFLQERTHGDESQADSEEDRLESSDRMITGSRTVTE